jgi:predicted deacylase
MQEIVLKSDFGIDIHSGSQHRFNFPQIRVDLSNKINFDLAKTFNAPVIVNSNLRDGSLRNACVNADIPIIVYEGGEILRFDQTSVAIGLRGIFNVLHKIGMIDKQDYNAHLENCRCCLSFIEIKSEVLVKPRRVACHSERISEHCNRKILPG